MTALTIAAIILVAIVLVVFLGIIMWANELDDHSK